MDEVNYGEKQESVQSSGWNHMAGDVRNLDVKHEIILKCTVNRL
jgi:hypothetical protein